jgi:hypothetical protein
MPGTKWGRPYTFDTIVEYLEWIEFFAQLECAFTWARLFGTAIIVLFKEGEGEKEGKNNPYHKLAEYDTCQAYYPLTSGNGYEIENDGTDIKHLLYKITFTNILGNQKTFYVASERVVVFNAPHLELNYEGNSEVEALAKISIVQEQMYKSIMKRMHEMGAGIAVVAVANEDEKIAIDADIGDGLKYQHKIYTTGDPKAVMELYVPDIKANQYREIWDISQEEVANDMNMSKKLISGDPQGQVSSARWDTEISYTEVYQTQRHYKKSTENVLFLLGIEDSTFMWNDPFPTEQVDNVVDKDGNPKPDPTSRRKRRTRRKVKHRPPHRQAHRAQVQQSQMRLIR